MGTKVKGEAIKEGSIPLSALATEVKDKIENAGGGADWNAQQGEAGYIENKPFVSEQVEGYLFEVSNDPLVRTIHYRINNSVPLDVDSIKIHYEDSYGTTVFVDKTIELNESLPQFTAIENVSESPIGSFGIELYNDGGIFEVVVMAGDELFSIMAESTLESGVISIEKINHLDEKYISNTVIKTTPQTLSDDAKNQALANLGIPRLIKLSISEYNTLYNGTKSVEELNNLLGGIVLQEIPILGIIIDYGNNQGNTYIYTSHQQYNDFGSGVILDKLVIGNYIYATDLFENNNAEVSPLIIIRYNEDEEAYDINIGDI